VSRHGKWNLWGYVDARDVAQSCRLALESPLEGASAFIIAAADTVMDRPSRELMAEQYGKVPVRDGIGQFETLLSINNARAALGYAPRHSWRTELT
jgi:nucleoside-diphosphate-sugar epimerase